MIAESILAEVPSPSYVVDLNLLTQNGEKLRHVQEQSGCKIMLALKGFAMYSTFPYIQPYLDGCSASSTNEVLLAKEYFGKEIHLYAPAFKASEIRDTLPHIHHLTFNSLTQFDAYNAQALEAGVSLGLRINPEHSEVKELLYDPCAPHSRLGVPITAAPKEVPKGLSGILIHNLCEKNADSLQRTLEQVESRFSHYLEQLKWINLGGGHHITREDYDVSLLIDLIAHLKKTYDLEVILEPGEAVALNTGFFVARVQDLLDYSRPIAILDASATAHMPDVLEMPYRPQIVGAGLPGEKKYTYLLGGLTCLAGDVIGEYSFDEELRVDQPLVFTDMAHYTMVKNTTFNGVPLPDIGLIHKNGQFELVKHFSYDDYKSRLS